jgi:hypothetical protein
MDENIRRRLSLAQELTAWAATMPSLMKRISETLRRPQLTDAEARDIQLTRERALNLLTIIGRLLEDDRELSYDQLMALTDRLREEIAMGHASLDRISPE